MKVAPDDAQGNIRCWESNPDFVCKAPVLFTEESGHRTLLRWKAEKSMGVKMLAFHGANPDSIPCTTYGLSTASTDPFVQSQE